jgi:uncharacterized RDD family membrane protein YckC
MEPQQDLLGDFYEDTYERVSIGKRFGNYVIDFIVYYVLASILGIILGNPTDIPGLLSQLFLNMLVFIGYYTIMEGATKGKTIGKMATGCIAVKENGTDITWTSALLRSLSRLIPFEPFSAFNGQPWHDRLTKTIVVRKVKSAANH